MFRLSPLPIAALLIAGLIGCSRTNEQTAKMEPSASEEATKADLVAAEENWKSAAEPWQRARQNHAAEPTAYDVGGALEFGPNKRVSSDVFFAPSVEGALRFPSDIEAAMLGEGAAGPAIRWEESAPFIEGPVIESSGTEPTFEEFFEELPKE